MPSRVAVTVIALVAVLAAGGAWWAANWSPTIPPDAASPVVARAAVDDVMSTCLDRIERPEGWLDLCWQVARQDDEDPQKDYYVLRLHGTLSGEHGGVRWWAARARLVDVAPVDSVFDGWPSYADGPCEEQRVSVISPFSQVDEDVCGLTEGEFIGAWDYRVTWQCIGCMLPERSARPVILYFSVAVPEGRLPAWEIGADFGS